jgi:hypothetical protein
VKTALLSNRAGTHNDRAALRVASRLAALKPLRVRAGRKKSLTMERDLSQRTHQMIYYGSSILSSTGRWQNPFMVGNCQASSNPSHFQSLHKGASLDLIFQQPGAKQAWPANGERTLLFLWCCNGLAAGWRQAKPNANNVVCFASLCMSSSRTATWQPKLEFCKHEK